MNGKYSPTTLLIALELAKNISENQPLKIYGSKKFREKILQVVAENNFEVKFAAEKMQKKFEEMKEKIADDERKFIEHGGTIFKTRPVAKPNIKKFDTRTISDVAKAGFNLQKLSAKFVDDSNAADATGLLLPSDEFGELDAGGRKNNFAVRWNLSAEQRKLAEQSTETILKNLAEKKSQVLAASHFEYINREAAFAKRGDCIFTAHQLPKWANDNPKNFFQAADKYEGKNRCRYVEIEFSLPNELNSIEDYKKIIDRFLEKHLKNHYYAYAIHEKHGAFSEERHPHCHIMFSERLIDEVEKISPRPPEIFFNPSARKRRDGREPTFEEKSRRGSPKDKKWTHNSYSVSEMRADFAKIQNDVLFEKGFSVRVDHRSLKAQKEDAERKGDKFLAKLFDRVPEKYLRMSVPLDEKNPRIEQLKKYREQCYQQAELLYSADLVLQKTEEENLKKSAQISLMTSKKMCELENFQNEDVEEIKNLKSKILSLSQEVNSWKRSFISAEQAELQAKFEYMTKDEKKLWNKFFDLQSQKNNLQKFLDELPKVDEKISDLKKEVTEKISSIDEELKNLQPDFEKMQQKFSSPALKKNIQIATHTILQQNFIVREQLKSATEKLNFTTEILQDKIFKPKKLENIFSLKEVYDMFRRQYFGLKKESEKILAQMYSVKAKEISFERARKMAENNFVGGAWKKYREDFRKFEKQKKSMQPLQKNYVEKKLEFEKLRLEKICTSPESQQKIAEITTGILRKNKKFSDRFEELQQRRYKISAKINQLEKILGGIKKLLPRQKPNTFYRITSPENNLSVAKILAETFLSDSKNIPLVAQLSDNALDMQTNWDLMSELKKDQLKKDVSQLI